MKQYRTIASKITGMLLTSVFAAMLVVGGVSVWSLYSMKEISRESSKALGETAAIEAEEALEDMAIEQLRKIVIEKASRIEEKFHEGKACVVCARPIYCDGEVVGVAGVESYLDTVSEAVLKTKIGEEGYGFLVNEKAQVMVSPKKKGETAAYAGQYESLTDSENAQLATLAQDMISGNSNVTKLILDEKEMYLAYAPLDGLGWSFAAVIDVEEVVAPAIAIQDGILNLTELVSGQQDKAILKTVTIFLLIAGTAAVAVSLLGMKMTGKITEPIRRLTWDVEKIGRGDLDYKIDITTGDEIQDLGDAFNAMTDQMQQYIDNLAAAAKEKTRIRTELLVAAKLQEDMLADSSQELINRKEFILHARMTPAREVGGDFYDFFLIDEDHLVLLTADVSGKGVPAALFMMIAKILIQNNMSSAENPAKALEAVNQGLCRNNKNEMFVTAWIGVLTLSTGIMTFVNAGHTRPLLMQNQGRFRYLSEFSGLVLAGMEDTRYCQFQLQLQQGDVIFLYTDGVTEANDSARTFFGEERLEVCVNQNRTASPQELCQAVWEDVLRFQGEAEQYDDITMLALTYCKPQA